MFKVELRPGESVDSLIKRFVRKTKKEKIIEEVRDRQRFEKPSVKRRKAYYRRLSVLKKLRAKEQQLLSTDR